MVKNLLSDYKDTQYKVRQELFEAVKENAVSIRQMSGWIGVSYLTISKFLNGGSISIQTLSKINQFLKQYNQVAQ